MKAGHILPKRSAIGEKEERYISWVRDVFEPARRSLFPVSLERWLEIG